MLDPDPSKRKAWCPEKDRFLIIDCWGNFEFFKMKPKGREPGQQEPLPVNLFKARLDKLEVALGKDRFDVVHTVKADLRRDIDALPKNNVLVLDKEAELAVVEPDQFWDQLRPKDLGFLRSEIASILRARSDADFKAMRFETEVVELATALLSENMAAFGAIKESILAQVLELPLTVNLVARERDLIEGIQQSHWWETMTEEKLQSLVERLAPLMRFRQRRTDPMMRLDIADLTAVKEWIEFGPEHERMTTSAYREKVESYIRGLVAENRVLQKLQEVGDISESEIRDLARLLEAQALHITEDRLRKVYDHKTARFIQFIRHILGLEKLESWSETVTRAFDQFITRHTTFSALQIRFLQTLRTFILQTGKVERENLIAQPFTNLHPEGIRGLFLPSQIQEIMTFVEEIGQQAA